MDNLTQTLEVVSFTSNRIAEEICGLLAGLKYHFTMGNASNCRTEEPVPKSKTVFVFLLDNYLPQHLSIYLAHNVIPYLTLPCYFLYTYIQVGPSDYRTFKEFLWLAMSRTGIGLSFTTCPF